MRTIWACYKCGAFNSTDAPDVLQECAPDRNYWDGILECNSCKGLSYVKRLVGGATISVFHSPYDLKKNYGLTTIYIPPVARPAPFVYQSAHHDG